MAQIKGLSHITLICKDLEKMTHMLKHVFNAQEIYNSGDETFSISREKFFNIAGIWVAIMEGDSVERTYNHIAFQVDDEDLPVFEQRVSDLGLAILPGRKRELAEGNSLYFYDEDNHLFELHSGDLNERLKLYKA